MPTLATQKEIRSAKNLPFCYLCGRLFTVADTINDDHVPAATCFELGDRSFPLILKTHNACNSSHSQTDEKIGQLIGLKTNRIPRPENQRLKIHAVGLESHHPFAAVVSNLPIDAAVWRWIRGFHAALYATYLPELAPHLIQTPFPAAEPTAAGLVTRDVRPQHQMFVRVLKENRTINRLDRLSCNNEKLTYECVWVKSDDGTWMCIFALDLYDWKDLGDINNFPARGCAGAYIHAQGTLPPLATTTANQSMPIQNTDPMDPFGS